MLTILGLIIFGIVAGAYGTLVGIGGGPILVPIFLLLFKLTPTDVVATSLCVIFFNVFSGSMSYYRQNRIDVISAAKFGIASIPGALLGGFLLPFIPTRSFEIFFGIFIFGLGIYMIAETLVSMTKSEKQPLTEPLARPDEETLQSRRLFNISERHLTDSKGRAFHYWVDEKLGFILSLIVGFIAPVIGTGGGTIHVPLLTKVLRIPIHIATATAHMQLLICVLFALVPFIAMDAVHYNIAIPTAIGTLFGAHLGAQLSQKFSEKRLYVLLSFVLVILSVRLVFFN